MSFLTDFSDIAAGREVFIETGTHLGVTLEAAAPHFRVCHSVEASPEFYERTRTRLAHLPNVHVHLGRSADVLPGIIDPTRSTTFWLDAHYSGTEETRCGAECPLLDELRIIAAYRWQTPPLVLIDDAFMFEPTYWADDNNHALFQAAQWPATAQIVALLPFHRFERRGDVLYCWPT